MYGLKQYKQYLLGRHFVIRTDHAALSWLRRTAEPMPRLARWLTFIEQFDYEILHRPGTQHGNADGLSRRPIEVCGDDHTDSARVAAISYDPRSQKDATFDGQKAAAFLYKHLPRHWHRMRRYIICRRINFSVANGHVEDMAVGDAEVYSATDDVSSHAMPVSLEESVTASVEDVEVYRKTIPVQTDNPTVHTVKAITQEEGDMSGLAGGNLANEQIKDKEIGALVAMRLCSDTAPTSDEVQTESELTKKLLLGWNDLVVKDGVVYRRKVKVRSGVTRNRKKDDSCDQFMQILLPRCEVNKAIELFHAGSVGGHFGIQKTIAQVEHRFFWPGWRDDVKRYCRSCDQCVRYHRGKLPKHGPLKPVLAGVPYERWYIDLTGPHPKSDRGNIWILTCMDAFTKLNLKNLPVYNNV